MANKYTARPIPEGVAKLYEDGLTQIEIAEYFGVSQKMVFGWFKKLKIKSRVAKKRNQWGEYNHMWKGEDASYQAKHHWIEKQKGKPSRCENCKVTEGVFDWASTNHLYLRNVNNWKRLCRKCHRKMDKESKLSNSLRG